MSAVHIFIVFAHRVCNHVFFDFGFDFSSIFAPKSLQNSIKKATQKKQHLFNRIFMILEQIWDPILEPCWPILAPCWLSWRLLGLLLALLGVILAPRCPPGAKWSLPNPPQASIFVNFRIIFSKKESQHFHRFKLQVESEARLQFSIRCRLCMRSALLYPSSPRSGSAGVCESVKLIQYQILDSPQRLV